MAEFEISELTRKRAISVLEHPGFIRGVRGILKGYITGFGDRYDVTEIIESISVNPFTGELVSLPFYDLLLRTQECAESPDEDRTLALQGMAASVCLQQIVFMRHQKGERDRLFSLCEGLVSAGFTEEDLQELLLGTLVND
jgi:hypothetical protein